VTNDEEKYLFNLYPTIEEEWEYHHIQATLPYLKKEWILIKHNPKDKRSHLIFLTDETKALIQEIENVSDEVIKNATASIPKEEVENTVRVLQSMIQNLQKNKG
ncbi:MarR family winged helix-turn-helix transcriptional regulator, partial [Bacillus thuringiensis serovar kurstaki]|uniref:MarR family winged helix-turn-helix transcriptional regulator n=1 Tax=Bacillus thuringiensis TaxID=1428 RepID=UPI001D1847ED